MRKIRRCAALLAVLGLALTASSCGITQGSTLRVGVKDDVANFALYDAESGRYSGMEIDLAQILCDDLGYDALDLVTVTTTDREELLDSGEVDMVVATYSITDERKEKYDFSVPYYTDYAAIMVEESSMIRSLTDVKGCRIGVIKNSSNALSLALHMAGKGTIPEFDQAGFSPASFDGGITFAEYDTYSDVSRALEYGEAEAFVADQSILSGYMADDREILPEKFSRQEYGVCTPKDSELSAKVDEVVRKRTEDGTIDGLKSKWGI